MSLFIVHSALVDSLSASSENAARAADCVFQSIVCVMSLATEVAKAITTDVVEPLRSEGSSSSRLQRTSGSDDANVVVNTWQRVSMADAVVCSDKATPFCSIEFREHAFPKA